MIKFDVQYYAYFMTIKRFFTPIILLSLFVSCSSDPLDVDVSEVEIDLPIVNLDSLLINTPEEKLVSTLKGQKNLPSEILDYQLGYCLGVGKLSDTGTAKRIQLFVNDPYIKRLERVIQSKRNEFQEQESKILDGFKHIRYHLPKAKMPNSVVYMNSFFASSVFCSQTSVAIGVERYLGSKEKVIQELPEDQIFQWVKEGMEMKYLSRDVLAAWLMTHVIPETSENFASEMIRWGKIIYFTQAAFPDEKEAILIRYSDADYQWAKENEVSLWKYLVDEKLLFSPQERERNNLLKEAPFTVGLPEKVPDRLGQYLGWKMVQAYMKENPSTKLADLLEVPYYEILQAYEVE